MNIKPVHSIPAYLIASGLLLCGGAAVEGAVIRVKFDAVGANNGTTWANAYKKLKDGLNAAQAGDEVWVARGTYMPATPADTSPRTRSFDVPDGVALYGGFAGTETSKLQRNFVANPTILSGDIGGNDLPGGVNRGENSLTVLWFSNVSSPCSVDGFTIRGANLAEDGVAFESGGAVKITDASNVRVRNCIIRDNDGEDGCAVGASICLEPPAISIANCLITGNRSTRACITIDVTNRALLSSCTIVDNVSSGANAALEFYGVNDIEVSNSVLWGNSSVNGSGQAAQFVFEGGSTGSFAFCDIQGGTAGLGTGCVSTAPCFVDPYGPDGLVGTGDEDYRPRANSHVIDAGDGTRILFDFTDMDGDGNTGETMPVDLGRWTRVHDDAGAANTGVNPAVDMGAYEFQGSSCRGDVDGNGVINTADLTRFLGNFGLMVSECASADLNGDGVVDTSDLVQLLAKFGQNCPG